MYKRRTALHISSKFVSWQFHSTTFTLPIHRLQATFKRRSHCFYKLTLQCNLYWCLF